MPIRVEQDDRVRTVGSVLRAARSFEENFGKLRFAHLLTEFRHDAGLESLWANTAGLWDEVAAECGQFMGGEVRSQSAAGFQRLPAA